MLQKSIIGREYAITSTDLPIGIDKLPGLDCMIQQPNLTWHSSKAVALQAIAGDAPCHEFRGRLIDSVEDMESMVKEWRVLIDAAIHRNLFFDPDFLIPAFKYLADDSVKFLVVDAARKSNPDGPRVICGLVPIQARRVYRLPLKAWESWQHDQCSDNTPLIRSDCAKAVLNFMLDFLQFEKTGLLSFCHVSNEGEFGRVLTEVLYERKSNPFVRDNYTRASFQPELDAEIYMEWHVSKSVKKNFRRLQRRLKERGEVTLSWHRNPCDMETLIEQFLKLEASGWKGSEGTAIQCNPNCEKFFREMVSRSAAQGKLSFLALRLDGIPIAMLCDLYSDGLGYSYKTVFDNDLADFSPGLMIEIRNIEYMHDCHVRLMDSCTVQNNKMINRIWGTRIRFQSLVVPLQGRMARWATAMMPLMQQVRKTFA